MPVDSHGASVPFVISFRPNMQISCLLLKTNSGRVCVCVCASSLVHIKRRKVFDLSQAVGDSHCTPYYDVSDSHAVGVTRNNWQGPGGTTS